MIMHHQRQRSRSFGRNLNAELDRRHTDAAAAKKAADTTLRIFNNSEFEMAPRKLYGTLDGVIVLALAGTVNALWLASEPGAPGSMVRVSVDGQARVRIEPDQSPETNAAAWLSETSPGCVTPTAPDGTRQFIGTFADASLLDDAYAFVNIKIDLQTSGI